MSSRDVLNRGICVASALALLVAVMTSPIRPSNLARALSRPDCLRRNFAIPPTHSTRPSAMSIASPSARIKAVLSEEEEKTGGTTCSACCSSDLPRMPSLKPPAWGPASFGLLQAPRPLRC